MSRLSNRVSGGDGALHQFSHQGPTQISSHLRDPHELRVLPDLVNTDRVSTASYWAPERRFLRFIIETHDAVDIAEHRLCFYLRVPNQMSVPTAAEREAILPNGTLMTVAQAREYRVQHLVHLFRRLVVRDATGAVVVDAEDWNQYLHLRRFMDEGGPEPQVPTQWATTTLVNFAPLDSSATSLDPYDTWAKRGSISGAMLSKEGARICMRLDHPLFAPGSPILVRPQRLEIELWLEDPNRAFTRQEEPSTLSEECAAMSAHVRVASQFPQRASATDPAGLGPQDPLLVYDLLRAELYVRVGTLSDEMKRELGPRLAQGLVRSCMDYGIVRSAHARTQREFELLLRERLANLRRAFIAPFWSPNYRDVRMQSFDTTAAAIWRFQMTIRGRLFPREGPLEGQARLYEYMVHPLCAGDANRTRLTRLAYLGSRGWAHSATSAASTGSYPWVAWQAPRAFMLLHAFQPNAHETSVASDFQLAGGLSVAYDDPVVFRFSRGTTVADWPRYVSTAPGNALRYQVGGGTTVVRGLVDDTNESYWTAQNLRGSLYQPLSSNGTMPLAEDDLDPTLTPVVGGVPGAGNKQGLLVADETSASDTLYLWLFYEFTTRITEYAGGRIVVEH